VDHDRLLVWVVIEDHHLQQATGPVRADDEIPALAGDDSHGMANSVKHVFVADAVLRALRAVGVDARSWSSMRAGRCSSDDPRAGGSTSRRGVAATTGCF
jgi:hypothetical protein